MRTGSGSACNRLNSGFSRDLPEPVVKRFVIKALQSLTTAAFLLNKALLHIDIPLFKEAFGLAEQAVEFFPDSAAGHYILGIAKLKGWGDRNYASEKYKSLLTLDFEFAPELPQILKDELEADDVR